jgi:hypothetical protein
MGGPRIGECYPAACTSIGWKRASLWQCGRWCCYVDETERARELGVGLRSAPRYLPTFKTIESQAFPMPEVRIVNVPTLRRVWRRSVGYELISEFSLRYSPPDVIPRDSV